MKRFIIALGLTLVLAVGTAYAHGIPNSGAFISGVTSVTFTGSVGNTVAHTLQVTTVAQRRMASSTGAFSDFAQQTATAFGTSLAKAFSKPRDCFRDYRTKAMVNAGHGVVNVFSSILEGTC